MKWIKKAAFPLKIIRVFSLTKKSVFLKKCSDFPIVFFFPSDEYCIENQCFGWRFGF
jgi:hypothetical protein